MLDKLVIVHLIGSDVHLMFVFLRFTTYVYDYVPTGSLPMPMFDSYGITTYVCVLSGSLPMLMLGTLKQVH